MKNKKNIYFLLPLVLLIWGAVTYQFFTFTSTNEMTTNEIYKPTSIKLFSCKKIEPIEIDVNYRDPFLGKIYKPKTNTVKNTIRKITHKNKTIVKKSEPVIWPLILYKGIVSDTNDKNKIFMLIIDGKTFLLRNKDKVNGVTLVDGDRESIEIEYKNESKLILIE